MIEEERLLQLFAVVTGLWDVVLCLYGLAVAHEHMGDFSRQLTLPSSLKKPYSL